MTASIACFTQNCQAPVIGQCTGYRGPCGQFYCQAHSSQKLCSECAQKKATDEAEVLRQQEQERIEVLRQQELERLYDEYTKISETVKPTRGLAKANIGAASFLFSMLLGCVTFSIGGASSVFGLVFLPFICMVVSIVLIVQAAKEQQASVNEQITTIEAQNPGFITFYKALQKHKAELRAQKQIDRTQKINQVNKVALAVLLGLGGVALAAAKENQKTDERLQLERDRRNLQDIADVARRLKK